MTKRSRGVLNTRCNAIVSSTTPRFGPRCPPVWERTLISSSRTSCASCGRSCSRRPFISAGDRTPSSKRFGASSVSVVRESLEEFDFVIGVFRFCDWFLGSSLVLRRLQFFNYGSAGAIASDDFDFLLLVSETFLADFYQVHSFFVTDDQIFERQFTGLHLLDNFLEPIHCALKVQARLARFRFTAHGESGRIKYSFARKKEQGRDGALRHPVGAAH